MFAGPWAQTHLRLTVLLLEHSIRGWCSPSSVGYSYKDHWCDLEVPQPIESKKRGKNAIKKLLRKEIEEEFIIKWKDNLRNTETIFLLQSFGNQRCFRAVGSYTCYLNGSSAFLRLMLPSQEKRTTDITPEGDSAWLSRGSWQIFLIPCCLAGLFFTLLGESTEGFWRLSYSQRAAPFCGQEWGLWYGTNWLCQVAFSLQVETMTRFGLFFFFLFQMVLGTKCCCYDCMSVSLWKSRCAIRAGLIVV